MLAFLIRCIIFFYFQISKLHFVYLFEKQKNRALVKRTHNKGYTHTHHTNLDPDLPKATYTSSKKALSKIPLAGPSQTSGHSLTSSCDKRWGRILPSVCCHLIMHYSSFLFSWFFWPQPFSRQFVPVGNNKAANVFHFYHPGYTTSTSSGITWRRSTTERSNAGPSKRLCLSPEL